MLSTGCRPSEAAYLVLNNSFKKDSAEEGCVYTAVVPDVATKTKERYKWDLAERVNQAVELVGCLHKQERKLDHLGSQAQLARKLLNWFVRRVTVDCAKKSVSVMDSLAAKDRLNLRAVRARYATDWWDACLVAEKLGKPRPPNPLQHKKPRMALVHYVAPPDNSDDEAGPKD